MLLTNSVMDLIKNSEQGRIITIASQGLVMHPKLRVDLEDPEFENRKFSVPNAYYQSKLAQVMYTYWLSEQLKDEPQIEANKPDFENLKMCDISKTHNLTIHHLKIGFCGGYPPLFK